MSQYSSLAAFYDQVFPVRPLVLSFLKEHLLLDRSGTSIGARVLDVGCGPGHYAGQLGRQAPGAQGLDLDPEMIRMAQLRYPDQLFRVADMRTMKLPDHHYNLVFCLGNTAAHLTRGEFERFTHNLYNALEPGGVWIVQVINWDRLLTQESITLPPLVRKDAGLTFHRSFCGITPEQALFKPRLVRNGIPVFSEDVWLHPLPGAWLREVHEGIGFEILALYGDYDRSEFDPIESPACILVSRRPMST